MDSFFSLCFLTFITAVSTCVVLDVEERGAGMLLLTCTTNLTCCEEGSGYFYIDSKHINPANMTFKNSSLEQVMHSINSSDLQDPSLQCVCINSSKSNIVSNTVLAPTSSVSPPDPTSPPPPTNHTSPPPPTNHTSLPVTLPGPTSPTASTGPPSSDLYTTTSSSSKHTLSLTSHLILLTSIISCALT